MVLEKAEEPEIKLPTSAESSKKQESSRKTSISALLTKPKPSTVWIIINCENFWKRWEYQPTWPASWETCTQVRKQQLELDMEKQTLVPNRNKAVYCHPAHLTYMKSTSWETLGWKKHKLESRLLGEISVTSDIQGSTLTLINSQLHCQVTKLKWSSDEFDVPLFKGTQSIDWDMQCLTNSWALFTRDLGQKRLV